jgi:hypothetical protein
MLSKSGRGVHTLNPRQACNLAYHLQLDGADNEVQRAEFLEELNAPLDPMEQYDLAMMQLRAGGEG